MARGPWPRSGVRTRLPVVFSRTRQQASLYESLRTNLVAYWPLNETATSGDVTATNWVAGGLNMTSENSVLSVAGKINNGRTFVSANSERMLGNATASTTLFGTSNFTVAFWFKMNSAFVSGNQGLVTNDFFSTERGVSIYMTGTGGNWDRPYMNINYADGTGDTFATFSTIGIVPVNTWQFFCARLSSGTTLDVRFNTTDATPRTITKAFHATRQRLFFGVRYTTTEYLNGDLDEVAFWHRRLSDAEVSTLYNNGTGIDLRQ